MSTVVDVLDVTVRRGRTFLLDHLSWRVSDRDRWVIVGPNGAGKTTLAQVISARMFPTHGEVRLLGDRMGAVDVFELRPRIGLCSTALEDQIPFDEKVSDVVMSASYAIFGRWREGYELTDVHRARRMMEQLRVDHLAGRLYGTLSQGERQRTQIARALMADPEMLVFDEPTAGLDLAGRELLLAILTELAYDPVAPAFVLVTHHVEEIPIGMTHALLLKNGRDVAQGPIGEVLTSERLSQAFDMPLRVDMTNGRWHAQAVWG